MDKHAKFGCIKTVALPNMQEPRLGTYSRKVLSHPGAVWIKQWCLDQTRRAPTAEYFDLNHKTRLGQPPRDQRQSNGFLRIMRIAARRTKALHLAMDPDRLIGRDIRIFRIYLKGDKTARGSCCAFFLGRSPANKINGFDVLAVFKAWIILPGIEPI